MSAPNMAELREQLAPGGVTGGETPTSLVSGLDYGELAQQVVDELLSRVTPALLVLVVFILAVRVAIWHFRRVQRQIDAECRAQIRREGGGSYESGRYSRGTIK